MTKAIIYMNSIDSRNKYLKLSALAREVSKLIEIFFTAKSNGLDKNFSSFLPLRSTFSNVSKTG